MPIRRWPFSAVSINSPIANSRKLPLSEPKSLVHKHGIQPNGGSGAGLNRIRHAQRQRERGQKTFAAGKRSDVADASVVMIHHIQIKPHLALCAALLHLTAL